MSRFGGMIMLKSIIIIVNFCGTAVSDQDLDFLAEAQKALSRPSVNLFKIKNEIEKNQKENIAPERPKNTDPSDGSATKKSVPIVGSWAGIMQWERTGSSNASQNGWYGIHDTTFVISFLDNGTAYVIEGDPEKQTIVRRVTKWRVEDNKVIVDAIRGASKIVFLKSQSVEQPNKGDIIVSREWSGSDGKRMRIQLWHGWGIKLVQPTAFFRGYKWSPVANGADYSTAVPK